MFICMSNCLSYRCSRRLPQPRCVAGGRDGADAGARVALPRVLAGADPARRALAPRRRVVRRSWNRGARGGRDARDCARLADVRPRRCRVVQHRHVQHSRFE
jgi:hypothetical protein